MKKGTQLLGAMYLELLNQFVGASSSAPSAYQTQRQHAYQASGSGFWNCAELNRQSWDVRAVGPAIKSFGGCRHRFVTDSDPAVIGNTSVQPTLHIINQTSARPAVCARCRNSRCRTGVGNKIPALRRPKLIIEKSMVPSGVTRCRRSPATFTTTRVRIRRFAPCRC